jgi:hypothetical protein
MFKAVTDLAEKLYLSNQIMLLVSTGTGVQGVNVKEPVGVLEIKYSPSSS